MLASEKTVVAIHYTLKNDEKKVIDTSEGRDPLHYLHGASNIVPGLEKAIDGKGPGEKLDVQVPAEEGYGVRNEELILKLQREQFGDKSESLETGMQFQARSPDGQQVFTIIGLEDDAVTVDGNHPLAGETLNFEVEVVSVREATPEEVAHGHVHGAHGHSH